MIVYVLFQTVNHVTKRDRAALVGPAGTETQRPAWVRLTTKSVRC